MSGTWMHVRRPFCTAGHELRNRFKPGIAATLKAQTRSIEAANKPFFCSGVVLRNCSPKFESNKAFIQPISSSNRFWMVFLFDAVLTGPHLTAGDNGQVVRDHEIYRFGATAWHGPSGSRRAPGNENQGIRSQRD